MEIQTDKKTILMQARQVVMTSYNVTAVENRFFYYALYTAQKDKTGIPVCEVKAENLKKLALRTNDRTIPAIKKALDNIKATALLFEDMEENECNYNLISGYKYNQAEGIFKIEFSPTLYNHIINYTNYAPLNLDIMGSFKSFYTQRLYELMRLWSRTNIEMKKTFTIDEIRFVLGVGGKYPAYMNFKQRVLAPAIREINERGNMEVNILEIKEGRSVKKIEFIILDHETKKYFNGAFKAGELEAGENTEVPATEEPVNEIIEPTAIQAPHRKAKGSNIENIIDFSNKGILLKVNRKFKGYDFTASEELEDIVIDAFSITLEKDGNRYENINAHNSNLFIETLNKKLLTYEAGKAQAQEFRENLEFYAPADTTESETTATIYTEETQEQQETQEPQAPADTEELDPGYMDLQRLVLGR